MFKNQETQTPNATVQADHLFSQGLKGALDNLLG